LPKAETLIALRCLILYLNTMKNPILTFLIVLLAALAPLAAQNNKKKKKPPAPFKWVNPVPESNQYPGLHHATFKSPSMDVDVGYCIYLPPRYKESKKRYPVIYYLHGGRPGSEVKSIKLVPYIDKYIKSGEVKPMIYVFVNGGVVFSSFYYFGPQEAQERQVKRLEM